MSPFASPRSLVVLSPAAPSAVARLRRARTWNTGTNPKHRTERIFNRWARPLVAHLQQSLARANATYGVPPKWRGGERGKPWVAGRVGRGNWAGGRAAPKGEGEEDRGRSAARNVLERMSPTPSIHGIYIGEGEGDLVEPREELEEVMSTSPKPSTPPLYLRPRALDLNA